MCGILLLAATLWWSLFHPVDLDVAYMRRIAEKAEEYGDVAGFEICGDCHSPYGGINGLSMLDPYPTAHGKVDPARVRKARENLNAVVRIAHAAGKPLVYWHREIFMPEGLLKDVPQLMDADGEFDLLGAAYERYLRFKIDEAFKHVPDLDGLVLTITEADFSVIHNSRPDRYPPQKVVEKMARIFAGELERRGKTFTLRSFGSVARDYEDIIAGAALAARDHRFEIETKVTPYDFDPFLPDNPFLRHVPGTTLAAECDSLGEFFGAGYLPFFQANAIGRYVSEATGRGVERYAIRIDRVGNSIFDSAQEANLHCYSQFIRNPSLAADEVMSAWAAKRWAGCEKEMLNLARMGFDVAAKIQCVDRHVAFHQNPVAPTFKFIKAGGIFSIFRDGRDLHSVRDLWGVLPDRPLPGRKAILAEKDEAVRIVEEAQGILASVSERLAPDERSRQRRAWRNARAAALSVRAFTHCAAAYFDDMDARLDDPTTLRRAVVEAERTIEPMMTNPQAGVSDFDLEHSRAIGQDLDRVYFAPFRWLCREFLNEYRIERAMRRKFEAEPDVVDFVLPGGIYDDNRVARAMHGAYPETKADRVVRHVGNRIFPNGTVTVELKATAEADVEVTLDPDGPQTCAVRKDWTNGVWSVSVGKASGGDYPAVSAICVRERTSKELKGQ